MVVSSLYSRESDPWYELKVETKYICQAYAPMVFSVFMYPEWFYGSDHIFVYAIRSKACLTAAQWAKIKE